MCSRCQVCNSEKNKQPLPIFHNIIDNYNDMYALTSAAFVPRLLLRMVTVSLLTYKLLLSLHFDIVD